MIERSIQQNGFGRSVLLANDGTIIAGNATIDAASSAGLEDVQVVESDGRRVIAIKRTDIAPGSPEFHALAIADNRAAELADWDTEVMQGLADDELVDLSQFFMDEELTALIAEDAGLISPLDEAPTKSVICPNCGHEF